MDGQQASPFLVGVSIAVILICASPFIALFSWAAATGRDIPIFEKVRLTNPKEFRRMVLVGRVNGAMVTAMCFFVLFIPFHPDAGIPAAILIWPIFGPMIWICFRWTRWAWRTSLRNG
jgi:hypothetical protein